MTERNPKLRDKAIAAYEASDLKQKDLEKTREAASKMQEVLSKFGIHTEGTSTLYEIDGIRFSACFYEDEDGIFAYGVIASRKCSQCGEWIELNIAPFGKEISIEEFGQWLANPPSGCTNDKQARKLGFGQ